MRLLFFSTKNTLNPLYANCYKTNRSRNPHTQSNIGLSTKYKQKSTEETEFTLIDEWKLLLIRRTAINSYSLMEN
jgi:hypothetical protein